MTSLQTSLKQIPANAGYYVPVADCRTTFYSITGANDAPAFGSMINSMNTAGVGVSSLIASAGAGGVFRDHGLTLVSSNRVFRKVQLLVPNTGPVVANGTDGVKQVAPGSNPTYLTGFIELPGQGTGSGSAASVSVPSFTPVARLG